MGASPLSSFVTVQYLHSCICCTCLTIPPYGYPSSNALYTPAGYIARADFLIEKNYLLLSPYFYNKSMQAVSCPSGFLPKKIKERTSCSSYKFANYNRELLLGVILTGLAVCAVIFVSATIMFKGSTFSFSGFLFTLNMLCLI